MLLQLYLRDHKIRFSTSPLQTVAALQQQQRNTPFSQGFSSPFVQSASQQRNPFGTFLQPQPPTTFTPIAEQPQMTNSSSPFFAASASPPVSQPFGSLFALPQQATSLTQGSSMNDTSMGEGTRSPMEEGRTVATQSPQFGSGLIGQQTQIIPAITTTSSEQPSSSTTPYGPFMPSAEQLKIRYGDRLKDYEVWEIAAFLAPSFEVSFKGGFQMLLFRVLFCNLMGVSRHLFHTVALPIAFC